MKDHCSPLPPLASLGALLLCVHVGNAQELVRALTFDGDFAGSNSLEVSEHTVDADGNTYCGGRFAGTVDLDPGPGVANYTAVGGWDIFLTKLDPGGERVWTVTTGGADDEYMLDIALAPSGGLYACGGFASPSIDLDPGPGTHLATCAGVEDGYILKVDPATGAFLWAATVQGAGQDGVTALAIAPTGEVYASGSAQGTVDMDPGSGADPVDMEGREFLWKLDADGHYLWSGSLRTFYHTIRHMATTADGGLVIAGEYEGSDIDLDPGPGVVAPPAGDRVFVARYDASGAYAWSKVFAARVSDGLVVDGQGNVLLCGEFSGTIDLDPGPGTADVTGSAFVLKLDAQGDLLWARPYVAQGEPQPRGLAVDALGRVIVVGWFETYLDADPGANEAALTTEGAFNGFISILDADGQYVWAGQLDATWSSLVMCVAVDGTGNIHLCGYYDGTIDLDPGPDVLPGTADEQTAFLVELTALPLGVREASPSFAAIFPVPAQDHLQVVTDGRNASAVLVDLNGRTVLRQGLRDVRSTIDLSGLPAGLYTLQLLTAQGRESHRVVKQ